MKQIISLLCLLVLGGIFLSGCASLRDAAEKRVVPRVAEGVSDYCNSFTRGERYAFRQRVKNILAEEGHEVRVICAGDEEE